MQITRLSVENFRSIEKLDVEIPQICALIGPNNAGKSNILEALRRVLGTSWVSVSSFSPDDLFMRDETRSCRIECHVDPPITYYRFKNAPETKIHGLTFEFTRYKVGPKKGQFRFEQACLDAKGGAPMVLAKAPRKGQSHQFGPIVGIPSEVRDAVPLIYIGTNRSLKEQLPSARHSLLRRIFEDINRQLQSPGETVEVQRGSGKTEVLPRITYFRELMQSALTQLRTEAFVKVEKVIKEKVLEQLGFDPAVDPDKLDLNFTPLDSLDFYKALDILIHDEGFVVSASELGEGTQNAIVLAILQAFEQMQKRGAILLIEEPEMFLHPQMQRSLYKTLRRIGETNQVIYTTHSPHFVAIPEYDEILLVRKDHGRSRVRPSKLPIDAARREKLIKEFDPERNELFFCTRLLVVEGDTEKLAFPAYAKRLRIDLDKVGATIVEVGGKRNLMEFARVAESFGIPVGIIYDKDSSDFGKDKKDQEETYNSRLDSLAKDDGSVRVWRFDAKYEDHLRRAMGEKQYQEACGRHPGLTKAVRARLVAIESELVPEPLEEVLSWLGNRPGRK